MVWIVTLKSVIFIKRVTIFSLKLDNKSLGAASFWVLQKVSEQESENYGLISATSDEISLVKPPHILLYSLFEWQAPRPQETPDLRTTDAMIEICSGLGIQHTGSNACHSRNRDLIHLPKQDHRLGRQSRDVAGIVFKCTDFAFWLLWFCCLLMVLVNQSVLKKSRTVRLRATWLGAFSVQLPASYEDYLALRVHGISLLGTLQTDQATQLSSTCRGPRLDPCRFPSYWSRVYEIPLAQFSYLCGLPSHDFDPLLLVQSLLLLCNCTSGPWAGF